MVGGICGPFWCIMNGRTRGCVADDAGGGGGGGGGGVRM